MWFFTEHVSWAPQSPGHGSLHLLLSHTLLEGQSGLVVHSCLHSTYGSPLRPDRQTHAAAWFFSLHSALIPQEYVLQGLMTSGRMVVIGGMFGRFVVPLKTLFTKWVVIFCIGFLKAFKMLPIPLPMLPKMFPPPLPPPP